jgi:hypothetical protein
LINQKFKHNLIAMISKRSIMLILLLLCSIFCSAQKIAGIVLKSTASRSFVKLIDLFADNIIIEVDLNGNIVLNSTADNKLDYWTSLDGDYRQGKLKSIDNTLIDYYDQFVDDKAKTGRLKSIGKTNIVYYDVFDGPDNAGRIKSIGGIAFTYYDQYGNLDNIGKLKSIGIIPITYYDRFDISQNTGKLKSIGNAIIVYFSKVDAIENAGKIKAINGNVPHLTIAIAE